MIRFWQYFMRNYLLTISSHIGSSRSSRFNTFSSISLILLFSLFINSCFSISKVILPRLISWLTLIIILMGFNSIDLWYFIRSPIIFLLINLLRIKFRSVLLDERVVQVNLLALPSLEHIWVDHGAIIGEHCVDYVWVVDAFSCVLLVLTNKSVFLLFLVFRLWKHFSLIIVMLVD